MGGVWETWRLWGGWSRTFGDMSAPAGREPQFCLGALGNDRAPVQDLCGGKSGGYLWKEI